MTRPQLMLLGCLTRPYQVPQRLRIQNLHYCQIAGTMAAHQLLGIVPVRLHPIACLHRNQRLRDHFALDTNDPKSSTSKWLGFCLIVFWNSTAAGSADNELGIHNNMLGRAHPAPFESFQKQ